MCQKPQPNLSHYKKPTTRLLCFLMIRLLVLDESIMLSNCGAQHYAQHHFALSSLLLHKMCMGHRGAQRVQLELCARPDMNTS